LPSGSDGGGALNKDFMTLERQPDQNGDRVKLAMTGKFLPYKRY
jgi:cyanate lyase